jgi:DNA protecting protein DprA
LKDEHLAALLTLADVHRSDIMTLNAAFANGDESSVSEQLDLALDMLKRSDLRAPAGSIPRILLSELTPAKLGKRLGLIADYRRWGVRIISLWDQDYPSALRGIQNPPLVLLVEGNIFPGKRRIAIVGTRHPGELGRKAAYRFSHHLASDGWTIVSGLARGIDTSAHTGALAAHGTTLGILAGHLGHVFPPENRELFDRVRKAGALVSEVTPYTPIHRGRFIERNRITSGLSEAVIIAEFHGSGGTFQQSKFAVSQNRPLLAIDHGRDADPAVRKGHTMLLEMGAVSVETPEDVPAAIEKARTAMAPRIAKAKAVQSRL